MRKDHVRMVVGGYEFTEIQSMELVADLYKPAGSFRMDLGQRAQALAGQTCAVWINDRLEFTGIIDRLSQSQDKSSRSWAVAGRSLVGLLEDTYLTSWKMPPTTLQDAADLWLSQIPYIQHKKWSIVGADAPRAAGRVDVGDTVFSVLNEMAQNRGKLFWSEANGDLAFGPAAGPGEPDFVLGSNVQRRQMTEDVSRLHSEIILVSDSEAGHKTQTVKNPSVALRKPFAAAYNGADSEGLLKQANEYLRQEKMGALQLEYVVSGFSTGAKNWRVNARVQVDDQEFGLRDTYLVTRRAFSLDRNGGAATSLSFAPILAESVFKASPKPRRKDVF